MHIDVDHLHSLGRQLGEPLLLQLLVGGFRGAPMNATGAGSSSSAARLPRLALNHPHDGNDALIMDLEQCVRNLIQGSGMVVARALLPPRLPADVAVLAAHVDAADILRRSDRLSRVLPQHEMEFDKSFFAFTAEDVDRTTLALYALEKDSAGRYGACTAANARAFMQLSEKIANTVIERVVTRYPPGCKNLTLKRCVIKVGRIRDAFELLEVVAGGARETRGLFKTEKYTKRHTRVDATGTRSLTGTGFASLMAKVGQGLTTPCAHKRARSGSFAGSGAMVPATPGAPPALLTAPPCTVPPVLAAAVARAGVSLGFDGLTPNALARAVEGALLERGTNEHDSRLGAGVVLLAAALAASEGSLHRRLDRERGPVTVGPDGSRALPRATLAVLGAMYLVLTRDRGKAKLKTVLHGDLMTDSTHTARRLASCPTTLLLRAVLGSFSAADLEQLEDGTEIFGDEIDAVLVGVGVRHDYGLYRPAPAGTPGRPLCTERVPVVRGLRAGAGASACRMATAIAVPSGGAFGEFVSGGRRAVEKLYEGGTAYIGVCACRATATRSEAGADGCPLAGHRAIETLDTGRKAWNRKGGDTNGSHDPVVPAAKAYACATGFDSAVAGTDWAARANLAGGPAFLPPRGFLNRVRSAVNRIEPEPAADLPRGDEDPMRRILRVVALAELGGGPTEEDREGLPLAHPERAAALPALPAPEPAAHGGGFPPLGFADSDDEDNEDNVDVIASTPCESDADAGEQAGAGSA